MNGHMILWHAIMGDLLQRQHRPWRPRRVADDPVTLPPRQGSIPAR